MLFVASEFLITLYLQVASAGGAFRMAELYGRRVRRILPVTLTVLIPTLVGARVIHIGNGFDRFVRSFASSPAFAANVLLWPDGE